MALGAGPSPPLCATRTPSAPKAHTLSHTHTHTRAFARAAPTRPAADALAHTYFDSVRSQYATEDPLLPTGPGGLNCAFESADLVVKDYLRLILEEGASFRADKELEGRTGGGAAASGAH